jgi:hypothetical protein
MRLAARVGFAAWCVWFLVELWLTRGKLQAPEGASYIEIGMWWGTLLSTFPFIGAGCVLVGLLAKRPRVGLTIVFLLLSTLLMWKFFAGEIVLGMHPALGSHTLRESLAACWANHAWGVLPFILWIAPIVLLTTSMVFYPVYGLMTHGEARQVVGVEKSSQSGPPPLRPEGV